MRDAERADAMQVEVGRVTRQLVKANLRVTELEGALERLNPERLFDYWEGTDIGERRLHDWELEGAANFEDARRLAAEWYDAALTRPVEGTEA